MSNTTTTTTVATKLSRNETTGHKTTVTFNWDVNDDVVRSLAQRALVIQCQSIWRTSGAVPQTFEVDVSELTVARKPRATKKMNVSDIAALAQQNPEFMAALLAQLGEVAK